MTALQYTCTFLFSLPLGAAQIEISSPFPLEEQAQDIQETLSTSDIRTADVLFAHKNSPALRNYATIRTILETRQDLLLSGRVYTKPPTVLAIESNNKTLLRAILDIACPQEIRNRRCSQTPARTAVIHNATDLLDEILFPALPLPILTTQLNYANIPEIIFQYYGNRKKAVILNNPRDSSLFEVAIEHNSLETLTLLKNYLITQYQSSSIDEKQMIQNWLTSRRNTMLAQAPTLRFSITAGAFSCAFFALGVWLARQGKYFIDDDHTRAITTSFFAAAGLLFIAAYTLHHYREQRIECQRKQRIHSLYANLLSLLDASPTA